MPAEEREGWQSEPPPGISFEYYRAMILKCYQASKSPTGLVKIDCWAPTSISNSEGLKVGLKLTFQAVFQVMLLI